MKQLMTLAEATETFLSYAPLDMKGKYQLDRMRQLMAFLGNPQEQLRVIHIAGTSGKTSTAYFIRGMLAAAGQRTGLTVSPHIVGINERVQIDGAPLAEEKFLNYTNEFFETVAASGLKPTYFELLIALAYWVFAKERVDYAVIETGLGGLLDGTNVVSRPDKVCVITDIGLDHTEILGETLPEIAAQKAGIIQRGNHVLVRHQSDEIMQVFEAAVARQHADLQVVDSQSAPANLPVFQHRNWALAKAAFEYVQKRDALPDVTEQLPAVTRQTPPGRWERYQIGDKTIILDGAHNPQKLQALRDSLEGIGIRSIALLANLVEAPQSKIDASLKILQPLSHHLIAPEFSAGQDLKSRHSLPADELIARAQALGFTSAQAEPDPHRAVQLLLKRPEKILVVTGSFYLVSTIRSYIQQVAKQS